MEFKFTAEDVVMILIGVVLMCLALLVIVYSTIKTDSAVGQFEQQLNQRRAIEALPMRMVKR